MSHNLPNDNVNGLNKELCKDIVNKILSYKKAEKIVLYGSRAKNHFKRTSDIDIAIFSKAWSNTDINLAKDILDDKIKTPLKIDLVNFYAITKKGLIENIINNGIVLYDRKQN